MHDVRRELAVRSEQEMLDIHLLLLLVFSMPKRSVKTYGEICVVFTLVVCQVMDVDSLKT